MAIPLGRPEHPDKVCSNCGLKLGLSVWRKLKKFSKQSVSVVERGKNPFTPSDKMIMSNN